MTTKTKKRGPITRRERRELQNRSSQPDASNGHAAQVETVLVAGLPRLAAQFAPAVPPAPPVLPPQSNLIDLDEIAASLHREGFCLWLRHDGEEFSVDLECGVEVLPGHINRPRGRGVMAADAIAAAVKEKVRIVGEFRKGRK